MKTKLLILAITTFLGIQTILAQTEKLVAEIRNEVNLINKNTKSYTATKKDVEGISLEGTEATFFVSGRGLKKIIAKSYGETFRATTELYYQGDDLIFVYRKFEHYDTQIGMKPLPKVVEIKETRYYFENGKMIKFLNGKSNVKNTTKFWLDSESETITLSENLKVAFFQ